MIRKKGEIHFNFNILFFTGRKYYKGGDEIIKGTNYSYIFNVT